MYLSIILFILAILLVVKLADLFLNSAKKIGQYFGINSFIIGVVLIGLGASLPEFATSIMASVNLKRLISGKVVFLL